MPAVKTELSNIETPLGCQGRFMVRTRLGIKPTYQLRLPGGSSSTLTQVVTNGDGLWKTSLFSTVCSSTDRPSTPERRYAAIT